MGHDSDIYIRPQAIFRCVWWGRGGGSQKHTHTRAVFRGGVGGAFAPPEIAVAPPEICEAVNYLITCTHMVKTKKSIN